MNAPKANKLGVVCNILFFIGMLVVNGLANTVKIGGRLTGEVSDSFPNLFVPAPLTFAIWGVIYFLLLGFVVYQARALFREDERLASPLRSVGVFFILSGALNAAWIFAWHFLLVGLSLAIMLALLVTLIVLYLRLNAGREKMKPAEYLFLRLPFSVYLGWISVATIANVTAVLVALGWTGFGASEAFWAVLMIGVALALNLAVLFIRRDAAYSMVFAWAFFGARSPREIIFKEDMAAWGKNPELQLLTPIDVPHPDWKGRVGLVPGLVSELSLNAEKSVAVVCGPPIMIKFTVNAFLNTGLRTDRIYTTLEMKMQCGIGQCGRCNIGGVLVCKDGPVFNVADLPAYAPS